MKFKFAVLFIVVFAISAFAQNTLPEVVTAMNLAKAGKYPEAIAEMDKAISIAPSTKFYLFRAEFYRKLKNKQAMEADFERALLSAKDNYDLEWVARQSASIGFIDKALQITNRIIENEPLKPAGYNLRSNLKYLNKDYLGSLEDGLKTAELTEPNEKLNIRQIQEMLENRIKDDNEKAAFYQKLTDVALNRVSFSIKSIKLYKDSGETNDRRRKELFDRHDYAISEFLIILGKERRFLETHNQTEAAAEALEKIAPIESTVMTYDKCYGYCREIRAAYYEKRNRLFDAINELSPLINGMTKETAYRYVKRGELYMRTGEYLLAAFDFERAVSLDPELDSILCEKIEFARRQPDKI